MTRQVHHRAMAAARLEETFDNRNESIARKGAAKAHGVDTGQLGEGAVLVHSAMTGKQRATAGSGGLGHATDDEDTELMHTLDISSPGSADAHGKPYRIPGKVTVAHKMPTTLAAPGGDYETRRKRK